MMKSFVIGDIHGAYSALMQCLNRSEFNFETDRLICLGDVCDRRPHVKDCVEELLTIKNLVMIMGNHDQWALDWMLSKKNEEVWLMQGGFQTMESYRSGIPDSHVELFSSALYYYIDHNRLFVHGGINHKLPINVQLPSDFLWDRSLVNAALEIDDPNIKLTEFDEVFVGHTPTIRVIGEKLKNEQATSPESDPLFYRQTDKPTNRPTDTPAKLCNVWLMDTGAGWPGGKLSMMNIETKDFFQSDRLL